MNKMSVLFACLMMPLAAWAGEYRAIVEVKAMTDRPLYAGPEVKVLHVYQPGDSVKTTGAKACSAAACEVMTPDGKIAWVLSHKITNHHDLAAEQASYERVSWESMTDEEIFSWAIYKEKPVFAYACSIALAGGEFKQKDRLEPLCKKVRNTREVREARLRTEKAMESMGDEDRGDMLRGGAPIGAPKGAVYLAWGKPNDTKRTITKDMVVEEIVYDERIAYIENGFLNMIRE